MRLSYNAYCTDVLNNQIYYHLHEESHIYRIGFAVSNL